MKQDILSLDNKKVGTIDLNESIFGLEVRADIRNAERKKRGKCRRNMRRRADFVNVYKRYKNAGKQHADKRYKAYAGVKFKRQKH